MRTLPVLPNGQGNGVAQPHGTITQPFFFPLPSAVLRSTTVTMAASYLPLFAARVGLSRLQIFTLLLLLPSVTDSSTPFLRTLSTSRLMTFLSGIGMHILTQLRTVLPPLPLLPVKPGHIFVHVYCLFMMLPFPELQLLILPFIMPPL